MSPSILVILIVVIIYSATTNQAFVVSSTTRIRNKNNNNVAHYQQSSTRLFSNSKTPGDTLREQTGKRPSLHPTIINILSEALLIRSSPSSHEMEVSNTVQPLDVAMSASKLAMNGIQQRLSSSTAVDGDTASAFTSEESQLIAGRVVGTVIRFPELERTLRTVVNTTEWIQKWGEEASFGILREELLVTTIDRSLIDKTLLNDPLIRLCRAECLYALFLHTVETPTLQQLGQATSSLEDFLDSDRIEVLSNVPVNGTATTTT